MVSAGVFLYGNLCFASSLRCAKFLADSQLEVSGQTENAKIDLIKKITETTSVLTKNYEDLNNQARSWSQVSNAELSRSSALLTFTLNFPLKGANPTKELKFLELNIPFEKLGVMTGESVMFYPDSNGQKWTLGQSLPIQPDGKSFYKSWISVVTADMQNSGYSANRYFVLKINVEGPEGGFGKYNLIGRINSDGSITVIPWYDYSGHWTTGQIFLLEDFLIENH